MKSARLMLGLVCGSLCLALFSGCETERAACEREKRMAERLDEMQMDLDGRINGVNMEVASMRANPPVVVNNVPTPMPMPTDYNPQPAASTMQMDTIDLDAEYSKRNELNRIAAMSRQDLYEPPPAPSPKQSNAAKHIRVPVPVRTIQEALRAAGTYHGAVDGKVGKQTIAAISDFQRNNGLKADGVVGRQTWGILQGYVPAGMSTTGRLK